MDSRLCGGTPYRPARTYNGLTMKADDGVLGCGHLAEVRMVETHAKTAAVVICPNCDGPSS